MFSLGCVIECEKQIKGQDKKISTLCQEVEEQFAGEQDRCMDTEHREDSGMDKIIGLYEYNVLCSLFNYNLWNILYKPSSTVFC